MPDKINTSLECDTKGPGVRGFEAVLWHSRLVVLTAVVASLVIAFVMFYITAIEIVYLLGALTDYHSLEYAERAALKSKAIGTVIGAVDGFLIGAIMLIFSLGLYELFISKLSIAKEVYGASQILVVKSLDDLKDKLAKVIVLVLIVMFFEAAIYLKPSQPIELLYYAVGIALVGLSLWLTNMAFAKGEKDKPKDTESTTETK
ncbi:YqhA family protein [Thiomicrospira sp. R3]|uniref:YqhA family protein n=1 Tax=Thiomicrospira sp. R3 TaxID=3035472 RepID=UPI00259B4324|nr:YqhA family protein [Thiomicrospira sp. R3]WFE68012.1 YqhA family protein [Thiomicrospira sp. R3]